MTVEQGRYFILFLIVTAIIIYTIGFIGMWKGLYNNYFTRILIGSTRLRRDDSPLLLKKIKQLISISFFLNVLILIALIIIFPSPYPIIDLFMALSISVNRRIVTNHIKDRYGLEEDRKSKIINNIILWTLSFLVIGVSVFLLDSGRLQGYVILYSVYGLLALVFHSIQKYFYKRAGRIPIDKMKNHFRN